MHRNQILMKVTQVTSRLSQLKQTIRESDKLKEDLGIDSLSLVALIIAIEDAFEIEFDESNLDPATIVDIKSLVDLTERAL